MSFTDATKYKISHKLSVTFKVNKVLLSKVIMYSESLEELLKSTLNSTGKRLSLEARLKEMVLEQLPLIPLLSKKHY